MAMPNELQSALKQNGGMITTAQANQAGVSNERLRLLVHSGDLERVTTGIYVLPEEFADRMYDPSPVKWTPFSRTCFVFRKIPA